MEYKTGLKLFYIFIYCIFLQSKPDSSSELGSPKTTDDIVQERGEEGRSAVRRRHKTESVKQPWSHERAMAVELEQIHRSVEPAGESHALEQSHMSVTCLSNTSNYFMLFQLRTHPMICIWRRPQSKMSKYLS